MRGLPGKMGETFGFNLTRDEVGFYWICYHPTILCYPIGLKQRLAFNYAKLWK